MVNWTKALQAVSTLLIRGLGKQFLESVSTEDVKTRVRQAHYLGKVSDFALCRSVACWWKPVETIPLMKAPQDLTDASDGSNFDFPRPLIGGLAPAPSPALPPGEVQVWRAGLDVGPAELQRLG